MSTNIFSHFYVFIVLYYYQFIENTPMTLRVAALVLMAPDGPLALQ